MRIALLLVLVGVLAVAAWLFLSSPQPPALTPAESGLTNEGPPAPAAGLPGPDGATQQEPNRTDLNREGATSGAPELAELAGRIGGLVLDPGGNPLPGASVVFLRRSASGAFLLGLDHTAPMDRVLRTDADGRYTVADLPAGGTWDLCAWHPEFCFTTGPAISGLAGAPQELPPIQLGDGYIIEGTTMDMQGNPIAGAVVDFALQGWQPVDPASPSDPLGRFFRTESAEDGSFQFSGMGDGAWSLRARSPGRGDGWIPAVILLPRQQVPPLRVVLGPEFPLSGLVRSLDGGKAVAGALVSLQASAAAGGPEFSVTSGADGAFAFSGVPEGSWLLGARCPGYLPSRPIKIDSVERSDLLIELEAIGAITGRIVNAQGRVPAGATLELWSTQRGSPPFQPLDIVQPVQDSEGKFSFQLAEPGTFVLLARAEGCAPQWTDLFQAQPRGRDLGEIRLLAAASVRGRLIAEQDQSPIAGALVSLRSSTWDPSQQGSPFAELLIGATDVPPVEARTGADGRFELKGLPILPCLLVFEHPGIVTLSQPLQPTAGTDQDLGEVGAQAASSLTVRGFDQNGEPLAGGNVVLQRDEVGLNQTTHLLDAAGRARIGGLPSGDWWVSVVEGGGLFGLSSKPQRLWLAPGAHQELELRVEALR
jgi:hypothetical protein